MKVLLLCSHIRVPRISFRNLSDPYFFPLCIFKQSRATFKIVGTLSEDNIALLSSDVSFFVNATCLDFWRETVILFMRIIWPGR